MEVYELKINNLKIEYLLLISIVILGFALRVYGLDRSLWFDEVLSVNRQKDLLTLISNIHIPQHLFFLILHFFMRFGSSEIITRLPSVVFGLLGIILIYKVGKLLFGRAREGLVGAFLLSISTMHIQYSQEARYYSLTTFLTLLSFFFLYKVSRDPNKKLWIGFIFSTILAILSHWYMIFILLIELMFFAFMLIRNRNSFIIKVKKIPKKIFFLLFLCLIIISIISTPLIQRILEIIESGSGWAGVASWGIPPDSFFLDLLSFFSFGFSFSYFSVLSGTFVATVFICVYFFFLSLGIIAEFKKFSEQTIFLIIWIFLPTAIIFILSITLNSPVIDAKYLIFVLPGYLVCISKGICDLSSYLLKYYYKLVYGLSSIPLLENRQLLLNFAIISVILGAFVGVSVIPLQEHYKAPSEDWKAAVKYLESNSLSGDIIIVQPIYLEDCLIYYYEKNSDTADFMKNITTTMGDTMRPFRDFQNIIANHERIWIVLSPRHMQYFNPDILNWTLYNSIDVGSFSGVSIYSRPSGLIQVYTKDMSFVDLDSPLEDPVAVFLHDNDSATFNITISNDSNYTVIIHAQSWISSALDVIIDGESKGIKTFIEYEWSYVDLGTFFLNIGSHEIKIINREGGDWGDTNVVFDQFFIWPKQ